MSSSGTVSLEHRVGALEQRLLEAAREAADLRQRLRLRTHEPRPSGSR
jgi:hypothetical protein